MGTRSVIAQPTGDTWEGRYVHWDGYPSGVGIALGKAYRQLGSSAAVRAKMIDSEKVGWSSICGDKIDFTMPACWYDPGDQAPEIHGPTSYTARGETSEQVIRAQDAPDGLEWAYVLTDDMVGVLKADYSTDRWAQVGMVRWDDPEFNAAMSALEDSDV